MDRLPWFTGSADRPVSLVHWVHRQTRQWTGLLGSLGPQTDQAVDWLPWFTGSADRPGSRPVSLIHWVYRQTKQWTSILCSLGPQTDRAADRYPLFTGYADRPVSLVHWVHRQTRQWTGLLGSLSAGKLPRVWEIPCCQHMGHISELTQINLGCNLIFS